MRSQLWGRDLLKISEATGSALENLANSSSKFRTARFGASLRMWVGQEQREVNCKHAYVSSQVIDTKTEVDVPMSFASEKL
jgi:hypothetical protein